MDLSILQKVNELVEQGKNATEIRQQLQAEGVAPDTVNEALVETGTNVGNASEQPSAVTPAVHHEKVIQPTPGFDPNAK